MRIAILTISDTSFMKMRRDESGPAVRARCEAMGWNVGLLEILPDERPMIAARLIALAGSGDWDVVLTTGGTGAARRDVTPEATRDAGEREMPGLGEHMRAAGAKSTPLAFLSRSTAVLRAATLIVNLPGSPRGAVESFDAVAGFFPHIVKLLKGDTAH